MMIGQQRLDLLLAILLCLQELLGQRLALAVDILPELVERGEFLLVLLAHDRQLAGEIVGQDVEVALVLLAGLLHLRLGQIAVAEDIVALLADCLQLLAVLLADLGDLADPNTPKRAATQAAIDALRGRFGDNAITRGRSLR